MLIRAAILVYNEQMLLGKETTAREQNGHRLLLIKARIEDREGEGSAPPVGVMQLGATARAWSGWQVRTVDLFLERDEETAIREALKQYPAEVIGLSALTAESDSLYRAARFARQGAPDAVIVAGGPHASSYTQATLARPEIDGAVIGEGERTLQEILDCIAAGSPWNNVAGTAVKNGNGGIRLNPSRQFIENLDELPFPARERKLLGSSILLKSSFWATMRKSWGDFRILTSELISCTVTGWALNWVEGGAMSFRFCSSRGFTRTSPVTL